jgi:tetratricopeptide (TPR) repeat protein/KaiC/GvpD/RAD55 family RecA-like ATPase
LRPKVLAEPAFTGREQELQKLEFFLNSIIQGKGETVFISGEAGSGKSRLTREFLNIAKQKGVSVMAGWCLSDAQVSYFPFMEAFNNYYLASGEGETSLLQPQAQLGLGTPAQVGIENGELEVTSWLTGPKPAEKAGKLQALSPQVWKDQVFAAVSRILHTMAVQSPVVLFIEDAHWADSASLALLHYVSRAIHNSERVLILATFRSEELTADTEGHPHALAETLRMMRREDLFTEIKLSSLSQENVLRIAKSMIGGALQSKLAEKLTNESKGNPLFIVESLRMLHERKSLVQENDEWRLAADELGIPSKIKDIILRRLAVLKYAQRRVLDAASVIGEKFDVGLLSTVLGQDNLEVLETLNVVAHSTSLVCVEENSYRFDHARSRETLYEELSPPLKRGYHAKIAEKLEDKFKDGNLPFSDLAYHFSQAENKEKAVKYALAAGQDALARWSNQEAIKHFTYILQSIAENPENAETRAKAEEGLGDAYYASSLFKEATRTFEALSNRETGADRLRVLRKAMESTFMCQDISHLMELVKKAEPLAAADRIENARVLFYRGRVHQFKKGRKLARALEDYTSALRVFEEEYSLWDVALDMIGMGLAKVLRSVSLFGELGDFRFQMEAALAAGLHFRGLGLLNEMLGMYAKVIEIEEKTKIGDYLRLVYAHAFLTSFYLSKGNLEEALAHSLKALEMSKKTDSLVASGMAYDRLCRVYSMLGDTKQAQEYFDDLMKLPLEVQLHQFVGGGGQIAKAVFAGMKGQWEESNQRFKELFELLKVSLNKDLGMEIFLKSQFAWALERQGRFGEAKVLLEEVQRSSRESEDRFAHVSLEASLLVRRQVVVGEEFEMRLDLVNVSRKPGVLLNVKGLVLPELAVTSLPANYCLENGSLETKNRSIGPFQVETLKLKIKASKPGTLTLNPQVTYIDELGETKTCKPNPITITVQPAQPKYEVLPGRVPTGSEEIDALLFGGIPQNYAVTLTASSTDERELLVKRFLEAGAATGETTFYLTAEAGYSKALAEKYPTNFYLFLCNPQADAMIQSLLNVFKLKGLDNLTDIDIALTKAFRTLKPSATSTRRICVEIVSDILLQHHAVTTRRWLSALLPTLKSKGFSILAVVDPQMHPLEETQALLGLFDGEISIYEKETEKGTERFLKIRRLSNQKYLKDEICLTKE